ncbi:hypothetical protein [Aneurinibacillus migulanus]|uniref:hypothetical protein n=1 Tax=Aneurinibacillus migulanus TaxID=47500 RepID=UPI0020A1D47A|nr:hypothetical protein [Aneurinibacillus migulanus]MCP1354625.1 hypothetical protein [Aneurinibacillus migulanus]
MSLVNRSAAEALRRQLNEAFTEELAFQIAEDFAQFLDTFHSYREPYDTPLDIELHERYARKLKERTYFDFKSQPHFSPSSAGSCPRELYEKVRKSPRDDSQVQPHQRRWTAQGTVIGDWLQREILLAERHYEKFTGESPRFRMARLDNGDPCFEDFVKMMRVFEHNGEKFSLHGTTDGVMEYVSADGETIRVGLEVKSKQTTAAKTSAYSMRQAEGKHVAQCVAYSLMYNVDYFVICYVNLSKKGWTLTPEEYVANPDVRAFGIYVTNEMKTKLLDRFADIVRRAREGDAPPMDIAKFTFNGYKTTIAKALTDAELADIRKQVAQMVKSRLPDYQKKPYIEALDYIERVRQEAV